MNDGDRSEGEVIPTHFVSSHCFAALFFCGEDRMTHGDLSHHRQSVHAGSHNGKMDDWNVLGGILEELHAHSTMVGKMWLTLLLVFRMLVLGVAAEDVWTDEQDHFACNTQQPGCRNARYDLAFPVSLERGRCNEAPLRGTLLRTYVAHVLTRSAIEVGFMAGQYLLYGVRLYPLFKCQCYPCPDTIDCYVSKPTEKSIFMVFMQFMAALSLILNVLEILNLASKVVRRDIILVTERQQQSALAMAEFSSARAGQFVDTS